MQERSRRKSGTFPAPPPEDAQESPFTSRSDWMQLTTDQGHVLLVPWRHHVTLVVGAGRVATVGRQSIRLAALLRRANQGCVLHVATSGLRWQLFEVRGL